ncbi:DUF3870 domain-containing protein [Neobacillus muris]|uniref:DUF3870 domain-containing protein n=1 Tax=Neobacillus muris TaxID=2941334 RepID=UPI00203D4078|nr:DUF3870 domain-containing protein [Neobacillus muris]
MNSQLKMETVLVTAYAKAPTGSAMFEIYKHAGIVLEINPVDHSIVDAEFTFVTDLAKDFIKRLVVGYHLSNGIDELVKRIEEHYFAPSTNSVIVALKAAYKRYFEKINQLENKK